MTLCDADDFAEERETPFFDPEGPPPPPPIRDPRPPQIVGFEPGNREELTLRLPGLNPPIGARDRRIVPPELLSVNVRTGKLTPLDPSQVRGANDGRLPAAPSLRREVADELARKFPLRNVALLDWSERMENVLVRVTGGSDPGRVFVYQRQYNLVLEVFRTAPWLTAKNLNESRVVELEPQPGVKLSGHFTSPRTPRLKPPPLLVSFPDGFPGRTQPDFDPEAQAFADLGFAVLRLNHRYDRNLPAAQRDLARSAIDRLSVDDAVAMLQKVAAQFSTPPFDAKHVATLGRGFGGYLAVRALQLRPEVFRAGIAIDAPMDLRPWLNPFEGAPPRDIPRDLLTGSDVPWAKLSVRDNLDTLKHPVFFLVEPARNAEVERTVSAVRSAQKAKKRTAEYLELDPAFNNAQPKTRAAVYRKVEEFLNLWLYDYKVRIGPPQEVK
jgi:pimeloyl-ACP methyl ester carboxylesterase